MDPPVSEKQRRAMFAAAAGHSTLGIPRKVGQEFVGKDDEKLTKDAVDYSPGKGDDRCGLCAHYLGAGVCELVQGVIAPDGWCNKFAAALASFAAGVAVRAPDGDLLFMRRSADATDHQGEWAFPGGGIEAEDATTEATARRELREETGYTASGPVVSIHRADAFETFLHDAPGKFEPRMDGEHSEYCWAPASSPPQPLHPGVAAALAEPIALTLLATDESVRTLDRDGRLHVAIANISKACVNPYLGREIPNWQGLGLDPERRYRLLRHPDELAKAAPSFNGLPLLSTHVPVTADAHPHELVAGALGTEARFVHPYLQNSLVIWPRDDIDAVLEEVKRELSSGYHYRADMTAGDYEGEPYDGVMRDIVGNHVALVTKGRAGSDVVVGDSAKAITTQEIEPMAVKLKSRTAVALYGALSAHLLPLLATDKAFDVAPLLVDVTAKNFKDKKAAIVAGVKKGTETLLAKDASIDGVAKLLDKLPLAADEDDPDEKKKAEITAEDDEPTKFLKEKLSAEDYAAYDAKRSARDAEEEEEEKKRREKEGKAMDAAEVDKIVETATKAAIEATNKVQRATRDAERFVRKWVGELAVACDSEEGVYRTALNTLGVRHEGVHPSALKAILEAQPVPGARPPRQPALAGDSAGAKSFAERYPSVAKIRSV